MVKPEQLRPNRKDGLGFCRKVEGVRRLVEVEPVHPVSVIEKERLALPPVNQKSVEPSIQARRKLRIFFIKVNQVGGPFRLHLMSAALQAPCRSGLRILFAGKHQHDVLPLVEQRLPIRKGILLYGPPHINAQRLIHPRSRVVKGLVVNGLHHPAQLRLGAFARHLRNETHNSRHGCFRLNLSRWLKAIPGWQPVPKRAQGR